VLCVRGSRTVSERQEPPSREKPAGHLVACFGQSRDFGVEESFEDPVASEKGRPAPGGEVLCLNPHFLRPRHLRALYSSNVKPACRMMALNVTLATSL
jgi:hypothetical protein